MISAQFTVKMCIAA